ncbi:MAG: transposase [Planctomycetota bacterium]
MEACGPVSDACKQRGLKTIVCSTHDEAWAWKNTKRKTDRDDALKLAKMAMLDALTPVHVPTPEVRQQRILIKYRKKLDGRINRIKNSIRALFVTQGIEIDTGKRAWCLEIKKLPVATGQTTDFIVAAISGRRKLGHHYPKRLHRRSVASHGSSSLVAK